MSTEKVRSVEDIMAELKLNDVRFIYQIFPRFRVLALFFRYLDNLNVLAAAKALPDFQAGGAVRAVNKNCLFQAVIPLLSLDLKL